MSTVVVFTSMHVPGLPATTVRLLRADVAVAPIVLALQRFGATFKKFPNLAKYAETMKVRACPGCPNVVPQLHWEPPALHIS